MSGRRFAGQAGVTVRSRFALHESAGRINKSLNQVASVFIDGNRCTNRLKDSSATCDSLKLMIERVSALRPSRDCSRIRPETMGRESVNDCFLNRWVVAVDWMHSARLLCGLVQAVGAKSGGLLDLPLALGFRTNSRGYRPSLSSRLIALSAGRGIGAPVGRLCAAMKSRMACSVV